MSKKELNLDEQFLQWWEQKLVEDGCDLDELQIKIAVHPTAIHLQKLYSYRDFFQAVRKGEYWPLCAYHAAYHFVGHRYKQSENDEIIDNVLPFGKSPKSQE